MYFVQISPFPAVWGQESLLACSSSVWGLVGWLFWVSRPFETVFQSISGRLPKRGRKRREGIDESKNVQTTPTRTYCKCSRPLPYSNPNCRTPRHWKFTQHHRTTRPPPGLGRVSRMSCFSFLSAFSCFCLVF